MSAKTMSKKMSRKSLDDVRRDSCIDLPAGVGRQVHPNASRIIAAIAHDDVWRFMAEITVTNPTPEADTPLPRHAGSSPTSSSSLSPAHATPESPTGGKGKRGTVLASSTASGAGASHSHVTTGGAFVPDPTHEQETLIGKYILTSNGQNAAHVAAANDAFNVLSFLLRMPTVDLRSTQTTDTLWTPLHFAAFNRSERICALLRSMGVNLDIVDVYGERASDIAASLGDRGLAERLGDTSNSIEESRKKDAAYQLLLKQARAFEEQRKRELEERLRQAEERAQIRQQQLAMADMRRKLKAEFEAQRLMYIRERWLTGRQIVERERIADLAAVHLHLLENLCLYSAAQATAKQKARQAEEEEAARAAASAKRTGKGKKGGKQRTSRSKSVRSPSLGAGLLGGALGIGNGGEEDPLQAALGAVDAELPLPDPNDKKLSKEEKKEVQKQRAKVLKERKLRKEEISRWFAEKQMEQYQQQDALEEECLEGRKVVETGWFVGLGNLGQKDPSLDRTHRGFFRFDEFEERFVWSCCAQWDDPMALGCQSREDPRRAYVHVGVFFFHITDCNCGGEVKATVDASGQPILASRFRPSLRDLLRRSSSSAALQPEDRSLAGRQERNQRRLGAPEKRSYCSPGSSCWSCCGATTQRAPGCTPQSMFLYGKHLLCDVRFTPAVRVTSLAHRLGPPATSSPLSSSLLGGRAQLSPLQRATDIEIVRETAEQALARQRALDGDAEPLSPAERMSERLHERSLEITTALLQPSDPESNVKLDFILGVDGVALATTDPNAEDSALGGGFPEAEARARAKYAHAYHIPEGSYVLLHGGKLRVSCGGRRIEHLAPVSLHRGGTAATALLRNRQPLATAVNEARSTRVNLIGNIVWQTEFLADIRRKANSALDTSCAMPASSIAVGADGDASLSFLTTERRSQPDGAEMNASAASLLPGEDGEDGVAGTVSSVGDSAIASTHTPAALSKEVESRCASTSSPRTSLLSSRSPNKKKHRDKSPSSLLSPACPAVSSEECASLPYLSGLPEFASQGLSKSLASGGYCAYAFEVRLSCCPTPASITEERLIVGLVCPDDIPAEASGEDDDSDADDDGNERGESMGGDGSAVPSRRRRRGSTTSADDQVSLDDTEMFRSLSAADMSATASSTSPSRSPRGTTTVSQRKRKHRAAIAVVRGDDNGDDVGDDDDVDDDGRRSSGTMAAQKSDAQEAARQHRLKMRLGGGAARNRSSSVSFPLESEVAMPTDENSVWPSATSMPRNGSDATLGNRSQSSSMLRVPPHVHHYFAAPGRYLTGDHGIGWWSYSRIIKGLGTHTDVPVELVEGDLVLFLLDGLNQALHVFHNREYLVSIRVDTQKSYVPALTLVGGCRVEIEYFGRNSLQYVDKWWSERATVERVMRLTTDANELDAKLAAMEEAKRNASSRGGQRDGRQASGTKLTRERDKAGPLSLERLPEDEDSHILF